MEDVTKVEQLSKSYGNLLAVNNVNLPIRYDMAFGLFRADGAGKSTTIGCILGTKKSDNGKVFVLGVNSLIERKKLFEKIDVQFQEANYQDRITVPEPCKVIVSLYQKAADYLDLLQRFGIPDKIKGPVTELSRGQRQRLFIVLVLIPNPEVAFLDELTTGLDVKAHRDVWRVLSGLEGKGLTTLLTSHSMDEVEALCDCICILK